MAVAKKRSYSLILIVTLAIVIPVVFFSIKSYLKTVTENSQNYPSIPDNSPLGVATNFYQWYTSCLAENHEDEAADISPATCYQKTTYLSANLVRKIDSNQKSILCGKTLDFHTVSAKIISLADSESTLDINNSKTQDFVAEVRTQLVNKNWLITNISCPP